MDYTELSKDEQIQILTQRTRQYEAEHFNHTVNKELLLATVPAGGTPDEQTAAAIKAADEAIKTLDGAHKATRAKITQLKPTTTPTTPTTPTSPPRPGNA